MWHLIWWVEIENYVIKMVDPTRMKELLEEIDTMWMTILHKQRTDIIKLLLLLVGSDISKYCGVVEVKIGNG